MFLFNFLKTRCFEGVVAQKFSMLFEKLDRKTPRHAFFDLFFQKICLPRRKLGQIWVFIVVYKINLVDDLKKIYKIPALSRETPRSALAYNVSLFVSIDIEQFCSFLSQYCLFKKLFFPAKLTKTLNFPHKSSCIRQFISLDIKSCTFVQLKLFFDT